MNHRASILLAAVAILAGTAACRRSAQPPAVQASLKGRVLERIEAPPYTYLRLATAQGELWAAVPAATVDVGRDVALVNATLITGFESRQLQRRFEKIHFGTLEGQVARSPMGSAHAPESPAGRLPDMHAMARQGADDAPDVKVHRAEGPDARTVAEVWDQRSALKEKPVTLRGKVVRFNASILGRNWIHLRDGSGSKAQGNHDLTVTSKDAVQVGDVVTARGILRLDKDFGSGYTYPVILEDARIQK